MDIYPSHRFHPTMKEGQFAVVVDAGQDAALMVDPAWRDSPYSAEESAAYMAKKPTAKTPQIPLPTPPADPPPPLTLEGLAATLEFRISGLEAAVAAFSDRLAKLETPAA